MTHPDSLNTGEWKTNLAKFPKWKLEETSDAFSLNIEIQSPVIILVEKC